MIGELVHVLTSAVLSVVLGATAPSDSVQRTCPTYGPSAVGGYVADARLDEISGIVPSSRTDGALWTIEDSGNVAAVYALALTGELESTVQVELATNVDWEAIERTKGRLWIGDIGDNARGRSEIRVYWFAEPDVTRTVVRANVLTLRYPDGPHDAEAMIVDGTRERLYIFEKQAAGVASTVYVVSVADLAPNDSRTLRAVATVPIDTITAADLGVRSILVTNYESATVFRWTRGTPIGAALRDVPCPLGIAFGSESISFALGEARIYAIPEGGNAPILSSRLVVGGATQRVVPTSIRSPG